MTFLERVAWSGDLNKKNGTLATSLEVTRETLINRTVRLRSLSSWR